MALSVWKVHSHSQSSWFFGTVCLESSFTLTVCIVSFWHCLSQKFIHKHSLHRFYGTVSNVHSHSQFASFLWYRLKRLFTLTVCIVFMHCLSQKFIHTICTVFMALSVPKVHSNSQFASFYGTGTVSKTKFIHTHNLHRFMALSGKQNSFTLTVCIVFMALAGYPEWLIGRVKILQLSGRSSGKSSGS